MHFHEFVVEEVAVDAVLGGVGFLEGQVEVEELEEGGFGVEDGELAHWIDTGGGGIWIYYIIKSWGEVFWEERYETAIA